MEDHIVEFTRLPDQEENWKKAVEVNSDQATGGYGFAVLRYLSKWAQIMEEKIAKGIKLDDPDPDHPDRKMWDHSSHQADTEGITGFMYGCAIKMLAGCWIHGEELRKLHNLKTQIGHEGEKANEVPGATLNPALLTIGDDGSNPETTAE